MGLKEYHRKRDFKRTPEPAGTAPPVPTGKPLYVIQKHAARREHYDFRLEMDGVLKSWAVPKGPSFDPGVKRLAVEVEDHPLEYGGFEGVIPKGEYGGGTVMLWDRGWWEPAGEAAAGYAKGDFKFVLHGEKLRGRFVLVRLKRREGDKGNNWLLIKERDATARPGSDDEVTRTELLSVASGRAMDAIATDADRVWRSGHGEVTAKPRAAPVALDPARIAGAKRAKAVPKIAPQLASSAAHAPIGDEWFHEIKFNGYRMLAAIRDGKVQLRSRNDLDWTAKFPELVRALAGLGVGEALLDGEIAHVAANGVTNFSALQEALAAGKTAGLVYMAFDLLYLDGWDLTGATLADRKAALAALVQNAAAPSIRYSDHQIGRGPEFLASVARFGLEGIVSKRGDARYRAGRSTAWLKIKCVNQQEFVVVGFTEPEGARAGFGALLLGYHTRKGKLVYGGRVGTGFSDKTLAALRAKLDPLVQKKATVTLPADLSPRGIHWVKPALVAEVSFAEWTADKILRHSSFIALRDDKPAEDVVLEPDVAERAAAAPPPPPSPAIARDGSAPVGGVRITHAERVVYPELGITKLQVAEYYAAIAERMLPHVAHRPLSLLRCPDGLAGQRFFQKHLASGGYPGIKQAKIAGKDGVVDAHVMIEDASGLIALVQMGVLEIHPWGSTMAQVEKPDRLIFDLDPDEGLAWSRVVEGAMAVRAALEHLGLMSFAKTTGGKGLHVVVPIKPALEWDAAKEFTRALVAKLAEVAPDRYTASVAKKSRHGRIFIDYLRNGRGATAVAAYSTRARPGATVSVPLTWAEVESGLRSDQFTLLTLPHRLRSLTADPWADFLATKQSISPAARRQLGVG